MSDIWAKLAAGMSPERRKTFLLLERPVAVACSMVDALRRARRQRVLVFSTRDAALGMLFAAARIMRLDGVEKASFMSVAESMWTLNGDAAEPPATTPTRETAP